jgi:C-terminal processing protease CtpA/Prc
MDVDSAVKRIRGDEGSPITLHLRRAAPGGAYELDLTMLRAEVVVPNVEWELRKSGVGVIRIDDFSEQTTQ